MFTFNIADIRALLAQGEKDARIHGGYRFGQGPGLWLVGDSGVYLISNADLPPGTRASLVFWSEECDPQRIKDWWNYKAEHFGADDGFEYVPATEIEDLLASNQDATRLHVLMTRDSMRYELS